MRQKRYRCQLRAVVCSAAKKYDSYLTTQPGSIDIRATNASAKGRHSHVARRWEDGEALIRGMYVATMLTRTSHDRAGASGKMAC
jgi:hypothetical protein